MSRFIKKRTDDKTSQKVNPSHKCSYHKCKNDAIGRYTVDLDINGLRYCKKHKNDISQAILWTVLGVEELAMKSMGVQPKKNKQR